MTRTMITAASAALLLALATPGAPATAAEGARKAQPQRGTASYYADRFSGRKMANGARFNPNGNNAAHRTLPLGTTAKVTNLDNGKTTEVKIEDRGPYVGGRVIDLSPKTAEQLDMKKEGTAPVVVTPVAVPEKDERVAGR